MSRVEIGWSSSELDNDAASKRKRLKAVRGWSMKQYTGDEPIRTTSGHSQPKPRS